MNYSTLVADKTTAGSIRKWVNHADIDVESVLVDAVSHLSRMLRVREMRKTFNIDIAQGHHRVSLPDGFLDPITMRGPYGEEICRLALEGEIELMRQYEAGCIVEEIDVPQCYGIYDESIVFTGRMANRTLLTMLYYQTIPKLSADQPTNFLTTRYSDVFRHACMKYAQEYRHDYEAADRAAANLEKGIREIAMRDDLVYRGSHV